MIIKVEVDIKDYMFDNANRDNFTKSVEVQLTELCPQILKMAVKKYDEKNSVNPSVTYSVTEEPEPII